MHCAEARELISQNQSLWLSSLAARNPAQTEAIAAARRRLCDEAEMGRLFKVLGVRAPNWPDLAGLST